MLDAFARTPDGTGLVRRPAEKDSVRPPDPNGRLTLMSMPVRRVSLRGLRRGPIALLAAGSLVVVAVSGVRAAHSHLPDPDVYASTAVEGGSAAAVAADDDAAAVAEAHRLVRLVRPPAWAHLQYPDAPVKGALKVGAPEKYLVGRNKIWTLPLSSERAAEAWLKSYDPPGLAAHGVALDNAPGTIASSRMLWPPPGDPDHGRLDWARRGFSDVRPSRIWSSARLSITLLHINLPRELQLDVSAHITLRGQAPKRDDRAGPRLQVSADSPCPEDLGGAIGVVNPGQPELDRMLVPQGTPSGGRVCYYGEYAIDHGPVPAGVPSSLKSQRVLDQAAAARLAGIARTVELGHSDYTGVTSGLGGGPGAAVLVLAYPGRPDVDLWSYNEGAGVVANGHIKADGVPYTDGAFSEVLDDLRIEGAANRTSGAARGLALGVDVRR